MKNSSSLKTYLGLIHYPVYDKNRQIVATAIGVRPRLELVEGTGIRTDRGILVDEYLETSVPHVYAAGDVAQALDPLTGKRQLDVLWPVAVAQGRVAGANMAGADQVYDSIPMFYSDFFDLGWEAVGDVSSSLKVEPHWKEPFREGVLFYLHDDVIRGVMLWNVWETQSVFQMMW